MTRRFSPRSLPPPLDAQTLREPVKGGFVPTFGISVPLEDARLETTVDFPSVTEIGSPGPAEGIGPGTVILPDRSIVEEVPPPVFVPHEVPPVVAVRIDPVYPPMAIRAELEENVFGSVRDDPQGRLRSAEVVKSDGVIFDASPLEAVRP